MCWFCSSSTIYYQILILYYSVCLFLLIYTLSVILSLYIGRLAYTTEDDAAILSYVSKRRTEIGGNCLWQEMEKQRVTSHSWQSMKYRYRVRLAKKQWEAVDVPTIEEETEAAEGETKVIYLEVVARYFVIYFSVSRLSFKI